jgi:hypothetical protein
VPRSCGHELFPSPLVGEGALAKRGRMRGTPRAPCPWYPSPVSHLRCEPPSPTRGEGKSAPLFGKFQDPDFKQQAQHRDLATQTRPSYQAKSRPKERAQGKPGARCTGGLVRKSAKQNAHEHTGSAEAIRPSLRNGLTAYSALSPATNSSCHRHRRIEVLSLPVGMTTPPPT